MVFTQLLKLSLFLKKCYKMLNLFKILKQRIVFTTKLILNRAEFPALTIVKLLILASVNLGLTKKQKQNVNPQTSVHDV